MPRGISSGHRFAIYALDDRGSGRSSHNARISGLADFAADFKTLLTELEAGRG